MVKYFLETENEGPEGPPDFIIEKVQEVTDKAQAIANKKAGKKNFFHICYHDEAKPRPCKREAI
jgi:hypothetical protein